MRSALLAVSLGWISLLVLATWNTLTYFPQNPWFALMGLLSLSLPFLPTLTMRGMAWKRSVFQRSTLFLPGAFLTVAGCTWLAAQDRLEDPYQYGILLMVTPLFVFPFLAWRWFSRSVSDLLFPIHPNPRAVMEEELNRSFLLFQHPPVPVFFEFRAASDGLSFEPTTKITGVDPILQHAADAINARMFFHRWDSSWDHAVTSTDIADSLHHDMSKALHPEDHTITPPPLSAHQRLDLLAQTPA
jgi:hypothetical protein